MSQLIENPTKRAQADTMHINTDFPALPIRGDDASVTQWCSESGVTSASYGRDEVRYSNDGARLYNFYDTTKGEWINEWGYAGVVTEILTT